MPAKYLLHRSGNVKGLELDTGHGLAVWQIIYTDNTWTQASHIVH